MLYCEPYSAYELALIYLYNDEYKNVEQMCIRDRIMMESMSAKFMKHFGQSETLTPFMDSLYTSSISFRNFYSAGIHTNHGLYATLYSFPAMMKRNLMKGLSLIHI